MMRKLLLTAFGAAVLTSAAIAQTSPPLLSVARVQVKTERMTEYLEIQKKFSDAAKKGGASFRYVLRGSMGNPYEVVTISPMDSYAERDGESILLKGMTAAESASLVARRSQCTISVRTTVERTLPDISLPNNMPVPKMVREVRTRVRPGMQNQYMALVKSDLLPALKKMDVKVFRMRQVQFGGSRVEFASATPMEKWSELDGQVTRLENTMGKDAYAKYSEKLNSMVASSEYIIFTVVADSSYRNP